MTETDMFARLPLPLRARIRVPDSPCWIWDAARLPKGYGTFDGTTAHRVVYAMLVGPIPDGFEIDHLCKNPTCVNPAHLEAITQLENNLRSNSVTAMRGRQRVCQRGHEFTPENTYVEQRGRRRCRKCRAAWQAQLRQKQKAVRS